MEYLRFAVFRWWRDPSVTRNVVGQLVVMLTLSPSKPSILYIEKVLALQTEPSIGQGLGVEGLKFRVFGSESQGRLLHKENASPHDS